MPHPASHHATDAPAVATDGLLDAVVYDDPAVCNRCYSRLFDRDEHDTTTGFTGNRPGESRRRVRAGTIGQAGRDHDAYGVIRTYRARTYCAECGEPAGGDHDDPLGLDVAMARAIALVDRLTEAAVPANPRAAAKVVAHLKTDPAYAGRDRDIQAAAAIQAVRYARIRDAVRCTETRTRSPTAWTEAGVQETLATA